MKITAKAEDVLQLAQNTIEGLHIEHAYENYQKKSGEVHPVEFICWALQEYYRTSHQAEGELENLRRQIRQLEDQVHHTAKELEEREERHHQELFRLKGQIRSLRKIDNLRGRLDLLFNEFSSLVTEKGSDDKSEDYCPCCDHVID